MVEEEKDKSISSESEELIVAADVHTTSPASPEPDGISVATTSSDFAFTSAELDDDDSWLDDDDEEDEELIDEGVYLADTSPLAPLPNQTAVLPETLAAPFSAPERQSTIHTAYRCHVGAVRARNEDSCLVFTSYTGGQEPLLPFGLYIVADGMGGHFAGHEASKKSSRLLFQHVLESIYLPLLKTSMGVENSAPDSIQEVMLTAVQEANAFIYNPAPDKDSGTTLTVALIFGRRVYITHVGDSRAYLLTNGRLEQLTTDHSYVQRLQDTGQITAAEAEVHPHRNVLYRAVGQGGSLEADTYTKSLPSEGKLLLCSDGLWGLVPDPELFDVLTSEKTLEEQVDLLVEKALNGGGHDNITAILVDFNL